MTDPFGFNSKEWKEALATESDKRLAEIAAYTAEQFSQGKGWFTGRRLELVRDEIRRRKSRVAT